MISISNKQIDNDNLISEARQCDCCSGSRQAQKNIFKHAASGTDLRKFLCGFFDTTSGAKARLGILLCSTLVFMV